MNIYKFFYKYAAGKERIPFQPDSIIVSARRVSDDALIEQKTAVLDLNFGYSNLYYTELDSTKYNVDSSYYIEWEYTFNGRTRKIKHYLQILNDYNYFIDVKLEVPGQTLENLYRGDTPTLRFRLTQNGKPFIIPAGAKIYFAVKQSIESQNYLIYKESIINNASDYQISVTLTSNDTDYVGTFYAELSMDAPGNIKITIDGFDVTFKADLRRP